MQPTTSAAPRSEAMPAAANKWAFLAAPVLAVTADMTVRADVDRVLAEALARHGHVDAWINNAGADILTVEGARGEILIPFIPRFVLAVDAAAAESNLFFMISTALISVAITFCTAILSIRPCGDSAVRIAFTPSRFVSKQSHNSPVIVTA